MEMRKSFFALLNATTQKLLDGYKAKITAYELITNTEN